AGSESDVLTVGPDQTREVRVLVTTRDKLDAGASLPVTFEIRDTATGVAARASDHFIAP
ncbi:MAG: hypothetical protein B7Y61_08240, partial [Rhizobiales bacterium 35-66-30]